MNPNVPNKIYTLRKIQKIKKKLKEYIENNQIPIIAEFAYQNHIPRQTLYEIPELKEALKELICKKEANLEKGLLANKINASGAIFSLKQLGWSDKQDIDLTTKGKSINIPKGLSEDEYKQLRLQMISEMNIKK